MKIELCMGSSCHVKGAPSVLEMLRSSLEGARLADRVTITGSVCLGLCGSHGANMKIDGETVSGVSAANFPGIFESRIREPLSRI